MYSRGSVIPLFVEQIRRGRPLTLTDPQMTRFLMSLAESVDLVEYAFEHAAPGDIFVRKAPASTVGDLALGRRPDPGRRARAARPSAHGTARSCTRRCSAARRWPRPRTAATTSACRSTHGRSTTASTSTRATSASASSTTTPRTTPTRLDVPGVVELLRTLPQFAPGRRAVKVAVTGAAGFLGWHTRCALFARGDTAVSIDRSTGRPRSPSSPQSTASTRCCTWPARTAPSRTSCARATPGSPAP